MKATPPNEKPIAAAEYVRQLAAIHGHLTPQLVLDEARHKKSPLHSLFDWNDTRAAERFRVIQASKLIRRIKVTIETQPERTINVRAFVNVSQPCEPGEDAEDDTPTAAASIYVTVQEALTTAPYRAQLLADCRRDITAFRSKYAALEEAAGILDAMTQFSTPTNQ